MNRNAKFVLSTLAAVAEKVSIIRRIGMMSQPAARVPGSQLEEDNLAVLEGCAMRQEVAVSADAYIRPEKIFGRRKIGEAGAGSAPLGSAPDNYIEMKAVRRSAAPQLV